MQTKAVILSASFAVLATVLAQSPAFAQDTPQGQPLSVIDWLDTQPTSQPLPQPAALLPDEPDVATSGSVAQVTVAPLDGQGPRIIGLVPSDVTGLPDSLWTHSDAQSLTRKLGTLTAQHLPSAQSLFYTVLLAETAPPKGKSEAFQLARIDALIALGAVDPAFALIQQVGPEQDAQLFSRFIDLSLLNDTEETACAALLKAPQLAPGYAARIFCTARAGDWSTAALLLGTSRALGVLPEPQSNALERFLDPDLFEGAAPLPRLADPDALMFRVYEALGQPISTKTWPRAYAHADLRDVTGWKAQLDAAERLATVGALPANRLLGVYSTRRPAASGGIWDRVAAVQRLETAIRTKSPQAIGKTLPLAWQKMKSAGLAAPFSTLFAPQVVGFGLEGPAKDIAFKMAMMSPDYEAAAVAGDPAFAFLAGLAKGTPPKGNTDLELAIEHAFSTGELADKFQIALNTRTRSLGAVLIDILEQVQAGAEGDLTQLTEGLRNLRALGLEDTSRRVALELLILGPAS